MTAPSKRRLVAFLVAILLASIAGLQPSRVFANAQKEARVDALFAKWDKPGSPGCALGVIENGRFVYRRGYGSANLDYDIPITSSTVFDIGSVSKQFTSASILLVADRGKLSLEDDIRKYVLEIPKYDKPITIRHLLNHTSGIRDYLTLMSLSGLRFEDVHPEAEILDLLAQQKELNFTPGAEYLYSNSGYFLLALIAKRASGIPMGTFAQDHLFRPLGMTHTRVFDDRTAIVKNRAIGYTPKKDDGFAVSYYVNFDVPGDGQVYTTVDDLLLWDHDFYKSRLGKDFISRMTTRGVLNNGETIEYALGLSLSEYRGLKTVSHGGSWAGFRADMLRFPDQKFSVLALCNLDNTNPSALTRKVADIYLGAQMQPAVEKTAGAMAGAAARPSAETLKSYEGAYRNPASGTIWKISAGDGQLSVDVQGDTFELLPIAPSRFRTAPEAPFEAAIAFASSGRAGGLTLDRSGQPPQTLLPVDLMSLSATDLERYAGEYESAELATRWRLTVGNGKLTVALRNAEPVALSPTVKDEFVGEGFGLQFMEDTSHVPARFVVRAGRVRNIAFSRMR